MLIYLIIFLFSILFGHFSNCLSHKNKHGSYVCLSIAILLPVLLAAFRDPGVGSDTLGYVEDVWSHIVWLGTWEGFCLDFINGDFYDIEPVYLLTNWISYMCGDDIHWVYFFTSLCIVAPIYITAYNNRKSAPVWLSITLFLLLYYNLSLNMIRQSMALSFCVYSFKYLEKRRWKPLVLWLIIIMFTHNTGIFYLAFLFFYRVYKMNKGILRRFLIRMTYAGLVCIFLFFNSLLLLLIALGVIPEKFMLYLAIVGEQEIDLTTTLTFLFILSVLSFIYLIMKKRKSSTGDLMSDVDLCFQVKLIGTILFTTSLVSRWAFRVSYYFNSPADCIFLPRTIALLRSRNLTLYKLLIAALIGFCLFAWYWGTCVTMLNEVYPYKSAILGIK